MQYYLTLDIGGTDMKYGVITRENELVFKSITPTNGHLGGKNVIEQIKKIFADLSKDYKLEGIAISSTGSIDETKYYHQAFQSLIMRKWISGMIWKI